MGMKALVFGITFVHHYKSVNLRFKFRTMRQVCFIFKRRTMTEHSWRDMCSASINNGSSQFAEHMQCVHSAANNKCVTR
jgi:hypothetical protein